MVMVVNRFSSGDGSGCYGFCRPVMALIDIEVLKSDEALRSGTLQRAVKWLGPPDGTVVLTLDSGQEFSDELVDEVVDTFGEFGEIILVRFVHVFNF